MSVTPTNALNVETFPAEEGDFDVVVRQSLSQVRWAGSQHFPSKVVKVRGRVEWDSRMGIFNEVTVDEPAAAPSSLPRNAFRERLTGRPAFFDHPARSSAGRKGST